VFRVGLVTQLDHMRNLVKVHYCSGGYLAGNKIPYKSKWSVWKGRGQKYFWVHKRNVYDVFKLNSGNTIPKRHVDFTLTQIKPGEIDTPAEQDGKEEEEARDHLGAVDLEDCGARIWQRRSRTPDRRRRGRGSSDRRMKVEEDEEG
jgi:hypothetical protein